MLSNSPLPLLGYEHLIPYKAKPDLRGKELVRKVEYEKTPDGKQTFKVTVSASGHGGKGCPHPSISDRLSRLWPDRWR
jgi:hypothetical protein